MTTINLGQKLERPLSPIVDSVGSMLSRYNHRVSEYLVIDYMVDDEGHMQMHIFPRVPDHAEFYPNNQVFAQALEKAVSTIIGRQVEVEAEFHEKDGVTADGQKADTRVTEYCRDNAGNFTSITYPHPVSKVWLCVTKVPGLALPKEQVLGMLVEAVVESTQRLVSR